MYYSFNVPWFIVGIIVTAVGLALVRYYKEACDNFAWGAHSYQKCKLIGLATCMVGILMIFNLHSLLLSAIAHTFFSSVINRGD